MNVLEESPILCPYCGEAVTVLVDGSAGTQSYVEDCEVCCRPMVIDVSPQADGHNLVSARSENEA